MNLRLLKRLYAVAVLTLAGGLMLLVSQRPVAGQDDRDEGERRRLTGTWNVTLRFPECTDTCPCPGGVPNIHDPAVAHVPARWVLIGGPRWSPVPRAWGGVMGAPRPTNHIDLTGPDAFEANATFDLFDASGNITGQGCAINETATRFE